MIVLERINDIQRLLAIENQWTALISRCPDATPFSRPQWLIPWWRAFGSGEMHSLAFWSDERLAGFIGLFVHEWSGRRQVTIMGNGITDYLGLIAEPPYARDCARLAFEYLEQNAGLWDVCDWQDLKADSALLASASENLKCTTAEHTPCTRTHLPRDADEFEAALPHGLRRTIRLATRRLEREGELRFETMRQDADAGLLQELFRLHESRWATKGGPESMMDCLATQQFLIDCTRQFSAMGKLRLYTMRYKGELSAIIFGLFDRDRVWGYLTGMDPALSRFSPGNLVLHYAMRDAISEGASAWEFLRGVEDYKFLWGARLVPKSRLMVHHAAQLQDAPAGSLALVE